MYITGDEVRPGSGWIRGQGYFQNSKCEHGNLGRDQGGHESMMLLCKHHAQERDLGLLFIDTLNYFNE